MFQNNVGAVSEAVARLWQADGEAAEDQARWWLPSYKL